jgi:hypothetical protein
MTNEPQFFERKQNFLRKQITNEHQILKVP